MADESRIIEQVLAFAGTTFASAVAAIKSVLYVVNKRDGERQKEEEEQNRQIQRRLHAMETDNVQHKIELALLKQSMGSIADTVKDINRKQDRQLELMQRQRKDEDDDESAR